MAEQPSLPQVDIDAEFNKAFAPENAVPAGMAAPAQAPAPQGPAPGTPVNVVNPEGKLVSIPAEHLQEALDSGYTAATPEHIDHYVKEQKYGGAGQQAIAGLEGLGEGVAGPLSPMAEQALGVDPEDIRGREEINPGTHMAGQITGLVGSSIYGLGEGALLAKAGDAAAHVAGLGAEGAGVLSSIGAGAVRGAAENALFQAGDETAKLVKQDPNQTAQTAVANIGLAGLLGGGVGGAFGAVSPLWKATVGSKLQKGLEAAKADADGVPLTSGPELHPIVKKVLSTFGGVSEKDIDAYLANREAIAKLPESDDIYQHALSHVEGINDAVAKATLDHADAKAAYQEMVSNATQSFRERGFDARQASAAARDALKQAQTELAGRLQTQATDTASDVAQAAQKLREGMFAASDAAKETLSGNKTVNLDNFYAKGSQLIQKIQTEGTPEAGAMANRLQQYMEGLQHRFGTSEIPAEAAKPLIQGLDKVSKYGFTATEFDKGLSNYYKQMRHVLDSDLQAAVPEYAEAMKPVREKARLLSDLDAYGDPDKAAARIRQLRDPLKYKSDMPMLRDLEAQTGSQFTHRIEPYANPDIAENLQKAIPEYAEHQKAAAIDAELKDPRTQAAMQEEIANSPEHRALQEAQEAKEAAIAAREAIKGVTPSTLESKLSALGKGKKAAQSAFDSFPKIEGQSLEDVLRLKRVQEAFTKGAMNGSRNINLYTGVLGGVGGLMTGHPLAGVPVGSAMGGFADKYGPAATKKLLDLYLDRFGVSKAASVASTDALRTAAAKAIDSSKPADAEAFQHTAAFIHHAAKGEAIVTRAAKNVFRSGAEVLSASHMPSEASRAKLDKTLLQLQTNPAPLTNVGGKAAYYMPDHGTAMSQTAAGASNYLNSIRPNPVQNLPLDKKREPSKVETAAYNRALDIAQQPMVVLHNLKDGRMTSQDVKHFQAMYPDLYESTKQKLMEQVIDATRKGETVPFKTRLSLSLFLGQPLDSTMTPQSIQTAQAALASPFKGQQQTATQPAAGPKRSMAALNKAPGMYQTPNQKAEAARSRD